MFWNARRCAYVAGTITIKKRTKFFANVGGEGKSSPRGPNDGGFNGGGRGGKDTHLDDHYDAGGGGGGATDLRMNNKKLPYRIMVAAGGYQGVMTMQKAHGRDLNGRRRGSKGAYLIATTTNQNDGNSNGVSGNGDGRIFASGSGGGGWRGGVTRNSCAVNSREKAISDSGSSYLSGYSSCNITLNVVFQNAIMEDGGKEKGKSGNGEFIITAIVICPINCSECTDCNSCTVCLNGYYLSPTKKRCFNPCPFGTLKLEDKCIDCSPPCASCVSNYNLYEGKCYYNMCPPGTTKTATGICSTCQSPCKKCSLSSTSYCTECVSGKYIYKNKCYN